MCRISVRFRESHVFWKIVRYFSRDGVGIVDNKHIETSHYAFSQYSRFTSDISNINNVSAVFVQHAPLQLEFAYAIDIAKCQLCPRMISTSAVNKRLFILIVSSTFAMIQLWLQVHADSLDRLKVGRVVTFSSGK